MDHGVAATAGGVAVAGGASAGVAAGAPGAIVDVAATGAGALGAAAGAAPKTGLFGLSAVVAVGIAAAAVLVVGGGAFAAVKLAGASGGDGSGSKARSPAAVASARAAALKASAPIGIYTIRSVLVSSTYQGDKPGTVTEGTIGFSLKCDAKSCTGASQTGGGTQRWDGSELSLVYGATEDHLRPMCRQGGEAGHRKSLHGHDNAGGQPPAAEQVDLFGATSHLHGNR